MRRPRSLRIPAAIAHPVRLLPLTFLTLILVGTLLFLLPSPALSEDDSLSS